MPVEVTAYTKPPVGLGVPILDGLPHFVIGESNGFLAGEFLVSATIFMYCPG